MTTAPSLFVSHGSPMFAVEPGLLGPRLSALGQSLQGVRAVLVVSPHWQTRGVRVMAAARPDTIHDFGGFPPVLYTLRYDVDGAPDLAAQTVELLAEAGFDASIDAQRGLDHGAWVPMRHLRPQGDLPVFQVSLPHDIDAAGALRLGAALAPLREQGVLIIGSGSMTHNLRAFFTTRPSIDAPAPAWVSDFTAWVAGRMEANAADDVLHAVDRAPHGHDNHPTPDHILPLFVAMGAGADAEGLHAERLHASTTYAVLAMDVYAFGEEKLAV